MTSQRPPELPDLTAIEPTFEGPGSQTMVQHLPVPPEDPARIDSIHGPAPRRQQKPATPSPPPQPPAPTLPLRRVRALGIPDLLAAKQIADSDRQLAASAAEPIARRSSGSARTNLPARAVHSLLLVGLQRGAAGDDPGRLRDPRDESSPPGRWTDVAGLGLLPLPLCARGMI